MEKKLRKIALGDLEQLQTLLRDFWATQLVQASDEDILEDIRKMLSPKTPGYLICLDEEVCGFIYANEKYGYFNNIEYLFVKKQKRGLGLGSFALLELKKILFEKGETRVQIEVNPSNLAGIRFYHSLGFDNIDTLTLSTEIVGKTEVKNLFGLDFKINDISLFSRRKK